MYKQFSYTTSINTSERIYKIEEKSKKNINKLFTNNILYIKKIFKTNTWLPTKTNYLYFLIYHYYQVIKLIWIIQ